MPDQIIHSIEPNEFAAMVTAIRQVEDAMVTERVLQKVKRKI